MRMSIQEQEKTIIQAQNGDLNAYDNLVHLYQDMAVAYGVSLLGDFHRAQDAAQEAFVEAFFCLPSLREPKAFPSWFRCIVRKHCDRVIRKKALDTIPLDEALSVHMLCLEPQHVLEKQLTKALVYDAVAALPNAERVVVLLFYMGEHSQRHIAEFLDIPVATVKKRLQRARQKLKQRMTYMIENELPEHRPSEKTQFTEQVRTIVASSVYQVYEVKLNGRDEPYTLVMLKAQDQDRFLPIYIGSAEANAIARRLHGHTQQRPQTYNLMAELVSRLGGVIEAIQITTYQSNVYYAILRVVGQGQVHNIDCRPSDALALAVQANVPVLVDPNLFYEDAAFEATRLSETVEHITPLSVQ